MRGLTFTLSAFFFLAVLNLQGQSFRPAYLITPEKDTLRGTAKLSAARATGECIFKPDEASGSRTYSPSEIAGFGFAGGSLFLSRPIAVEGDTVPVFLEVVHLGEAILLETKSKSAAERRLFLEHPGEEFFTELTRRNYDGILRWLTSDAPELQAKPGDVKFNWALIARFLQEYDTSQGTPYKNPKPLPLPVTVSLGPVAGLHFKSYSYDYPMRFGLRPYAFFGDSLSYSNQVFATAGIAFRIQNIILRKSGRLTLQPETHIGQYVLDAGGGQYEHLGLLIPVKAHYQIGSSEKIRPEVFAGVAGTFLFGQKIVADETRYTDILPEFIDNFLGGVCGGANVLFALGRSGNMLNLEAYFEYGNGVLGFSRGTAQLKEEESSFHIMGSLRVGYFF